MPVETRVRIPIRWNDLDSLDHVNQAVYHAYLEEGRAALFEALDEHAFPFVLVRVELDYRHEIRRDHGTVDVVARIKSIGRSSVTLEQEVVLPDGTVAAAGSSVLVAWDPQVRGSRAISAPERAALGG